MWTSTSDKLGQCYPHKGPIGRGKPVGAKGPDDSCGSSSGPDSSGPPEFSTTVVATPYPYKVNLFNISAFGVATPYPYKVSLFNILAFGGHLQVPLFQLRSQMQLMAVVGEETTFLHSILA